MESVEGFVSDHGIEELLSEMDAVRRDEKPIRALPNESSVTEEDWLAFLRMVNDSISPAHQYGPLPVPSFNHLKAERLARMYVETLAGDGAPSDGVAFGEVVGFVAENVDARKETVATYLEGCDFEEAPDGEVGSVR